MLGAPALLLVHPTILINYVNPMCFLLPLEVGLCAFFIYTSMPCSLLSPVDCVSLALSGALFSWSKPMLVSVCIGTLEIMCD